jgi:hypothetical protein
MTTSKRGSIEHKHEGDFTNMSITDHVEKSGVLVDPEADYSGAVKKTDQAEIRLVRKLDFRIMPILWAMYFLNYVSAVAGCVIEGVTDAFSLIEMLLPRRDLMGWRMILTSRERSTILVSRFCLSGKLFILTSPFPKLTFDQISTHANPIQHAHLLETCQTLTIHVPLHDGLGCRIRLHSSC